jgi:hypothetical protein
VLGLVDGKTEGWADCSSPHAIFAVQCHLIWRKPKCVLRRTSSAQCFPAEAGYEKGLPYDKHTAARSQAASLGGYGGWGRADGSSLIHVAQFGSADRVLVVQPTQSALFTVLSAWTQRVAQRLGGVKGEPAKK